MRSRCRFDHESTRSPHWWGRWLARHAPEGCHRGQRLSLPYWAGMRCRELEPLAEVAAVPGAPERAAPLAKPAAIPSRHPP